MEQYICRTEKMKDNELILEEGTWAYYAYILMSGNAKVFKGYNGKQVCIGTLKEGDIFGEMSFFGMPKRTASVVADGDVKVGMISKDKFMESVNELPKETRNTLEQMSHDLYYINDIYSRLANCLHELATIEEKTKNIHTFEREIQNMPDILRKVVNLMCKRFKSSTEGSSKLMAQLKKASKPLEALSTALMEK